ncbi:MFS transporter [Flavicella sediminum]|uniref:MFS transporter n=1 Tax=Flavicella sediminum TaxID=2585141 RepID=UPI001121E920|nr:MFS transporter [Flavicella sediminum]
MELKVKQRIAIGIYFFFSGVCFSTWASRIPNVKDFFQFNEAELGNLLMVMPIASVFGLPFSGWLVSRFNSRPPLLISFFIYAISLLGIGFSENLWSLVLSLAGFSFSLRIINIAMNTQAVTLQKEFTKKINGAFHGFWSLGGIVGLLVATLLIKLEISIQIHVVFVTIVTLIGTTTTYHLLLKNDKPKEGNKLIIGKPDPFILYLGLIVFFAAVCEGGIYDWNAVYFKEVINVEIFTIGYLCFMVCMTISRFFSDLVIDRIGIEKTFIVSAFLIVTGIGTAIVFPKFWPALIGFCITGFGIATIFPMAFSLSSASKKYSVGMVISLISTYSIVGMLVGPPLIGYLAYLFHLRTAFITFIFCGLMFIPISKLFFKLQKN